MIPRDNTIPTIPQPGDIALVIGKTAGSRALVKIQRLIRSRASFSHCAINFFGSLWCHAVPAGVGIISTSELFKHDAYDDAWKVLRRKPEETPASGAPSVQKAMTDLAARREMQSNWLEATMYYIGQKYNIKFLLPKGASDSSSFCSELIAKVFERVGQPLTHAKAEQVIPADLEALVGLPCWEDITLGYREYLSRLHNSSDEKNEELYKSTLIDSYTIQASAKRQYVEGLKRKVEIAKLEVNLGLGAEICSDLTRVEQELRTLQAFMWNVEPKVKETLRWVARQRNVHCSDNET